jgi:phosphoribosylformylglycinamidine (FGAM) synthase-like amidotransferase family enzyme
MLLAHKPRVAVLRQEGSNGDREMTAAFFAAGFEVWDVNMHDLLKGDVTLDRFNGLAFVGGFSYADVLDSAKGWAGVIRFNPTLLHQFEHFRTRSDTFSFGACNGCQLMALLGWVPGDTVAPSGFDGKRKLPELEQPRFIHNKSGRFESRFAAVKILDSPAIMLRGMAGSTLGVWVAHGEGQAHFPTERVLKAVLERGLAPVRYVNDQNEATEIYPFNPNGSPLGIAALCSPDGRHLAIMPHPYETIPAVRSRSFVCCLKNELTCVVFAGSDRSCRGSGRTCLPNGGARSIPRQRRGSRSSRMRTSLWQRRRARRLRSRVPVSMGNECVAIITKFRFFTERTVGSCTLKASFFFFSSGPRTTPSCG